MTEKCLIRTDSPYWKVKEDSVVTIIVSAYLRHRPLNIALKSIYQQTYPHWQVLVIADCCHESFEESVDLSNNRVKFINLPKRCGNQYGPNSVGIHLANTEYIAFLNHDDLWVSDHLETAIEELKEQKADFFMGKAAFCHYQNQQQYSEEKGRLVFSELNKPEAIWHCLKGPNVFFEPVSSWVIKNDLSKKIGYWKTPDSIAVTPVLNWIQRAAKAKARFCNSQKLTTLKFNLHHIENSNAPIYSFDDPLTDLAEDYVGLNPESIRQFIQEDLAEAHNRNLITRNELWDPILMTAEEIKLKEEFYEFVKSGSKQIDEVSGAMASWSLSVVTRRTGEELNKFIDPRTIISELITQRIIADE